MIERLNKSRLLMVVLIMGVLAALTYRQVFSDQIIRHPGNRRALLKEFSTARGGIYAADGSVLAASRPSGRLYRRVYPQGAPFSAVTGYYSPIRGHAGVEADQTEWLSARGHFKSFDDWLDSIGRKPRQGFDVEVSVRPGLQRAAWRLLDGRRGAVVALDPRTGAVLALVSRPAYDPNLVESNWSSIIGTEGLLVNRATQGRYPPGSTFKIITAASALSNGVATPGSVYNGPAVLPVYGGKVTNFADQDQGRMSLARALVKSTNTIFAQVGLELGAGRLVKTARDFGFNSAPPLDTQAAKSTIGLPESMDKVMLAWTAVGQGETLATPLEMALVASAVAAGGKVYRPSLVKEVRDSQGEIYYTHRPQVWLRATDGKTARQLNRMMTAAVLEGTAKAAALPGLSVAGKTGTAELGGKAPPHAWFIGFAPADEPKVAVAVLVENGGLGGQTAAPIAREVLRTALEP